MDNRTNKIHLNNTLYAISKNGKWGIQDDMGNQLISYQYDGITYCSNCIAVLKDGKVGLLNDNGITVIPPCYNSIECVVIDANNADKMVNSNYRTHYSKDFIFDSILPEVPEPWFFDIDDDYHALIRSRLRGQTFNDSVFDESHIHIEKRALFDIRNVFILRTETFSEIFSVEHGVFQNSRYDDIQQLTCKFYCVRKDNMYGVYDAETESLILECEYQRIVYEGGAVVKIQKNDLWGIKTINKNSSQEIIEIPISYKEINILDEAERLFSAKEDSEYERYVLMDKDGKKISIDTPLRAFSDYDFDSHFKWFSNDLILSSIYNKIYGFVNMAGHISVPFKYNYVEKRKDGNFDVNVCLKYEHVHYWNQQMTTITFWGILDSMGKEIVPLKYAERIPLNFDHAIVKDSLSGFYGMLNSSGEELIPCNYKRLVWSYHNDFLFFCISGSERGKEDKFFGLENFGEELYTKADFFSDDIVFGIWGCMKKDGAIFIDAKYGCYREVGNYITAGRDGAFLNDDNGYGEAYNGVFDLYNKNGELIIGGFNEFHYDEAHSLLMFRFGGEWKSEMNYIPDVTPSVSYVSNFFDGRYSKWLMLTKNLESIMRLPNGLRMQFDKGFVGSVQEKKKEDGSIASIWNIPLELLSKEEPKIKGSLALCVSSKKKFVVHIEGGMKSKEYDDVYVIENESYYYCNKELLEIGVRQLDCKSKEEITILDASKKQILAFTYPKDNHFMGVQKVDDNYYRVLLYDIFDIQNPTIVNAMVVKDGLREYLLDGYFSCDDILAKNDKNSDYGNKEDSDYNWRQDYWDAMTDGMYGDMPDDFDGDVDSIL